MLRIEKQVFKNKRRRGKMREPLPRNYIRSGIVLEFEYSVSQRLLCRTTITLIASNSATWIGRLFWTAFSAISVDSRFFYLSRWLYLRKCKNTVNSLDFCRLVYITPHLKWYNRNGSMLNLRKERYMDYNNDRHTHEDEVQPVSPPSCSVIK